MIDSIRISEKGKRHLSTLKRHTGIENWNVLCRWGFCLSLTDFAPLVSEEKAKKSNVEMTWQTFAGRFESSYVALLAHAKSRPEVIDLDLVSDGDLVTMHIERGLVRLLPSTKVDGISGLIGIASHKA
jgi:DNA sulfur modification protein DndE